MLSDQLIARMPEKKIKRIIKKYYTAEGAEHDHNRKYMLQFIIESLKEILGRVEVDEDTMVATINYICLHYQNVPSDEKHSYCRKKAKAISQSNLIKENNE